MIVDGSVNRDVAFDLLVKQNPFRHRDLSLVCLGGSTALKFQGKNSDIDIVTVMNPEDPSRVDLDAIVVLGRQINNFAESLTVPQLNPKLEDSVVLSATRPVIISTIRLEEAQIELARTADWEKVIPIHWLHYPSLEFAKINEPPELFKGLLNNGKSLFGNANDLSEKFDNTNIDKYDLLSGLDWLTDSFKVLVANVSQTEQARSFQPWNFLAGLSTHNLEYFWKWRIIGPIIKKGAGVQIIGWNDVNSFSGIINPNIWGLALEVRKIRHECPNVKIGEIIDLYRKTFDLWPNLSI